MNVADAHGWAADWIGVVTATLLGGAMVCLACGRLLRLRWAWVGLVFFVSAAGAMASAKFRFLSTSTQHVAWLCAVLCLFWSLVTAAATSRQRRSADAEEWERLGFLSLSRLAAVLFGVVTAIIQSVVLVMRMIYVGVDLVHGYPWDGARDYGFGPRGWWSLAVLFLSCATGLFSTRARHLSTVLLWIAVLIVIWACLLYPPFRMHASGAFERTGVTLLLLASLSALLASAVLVEKGGTRKLIAQVTSGGSDDSQAAHREATGFVASCGVLTMVIIVLGCYHLLVPLRTVWGGFAGSTLLALVSISVAATGGFHLLNRNWSDNLADGVLGLFSLGLCGLATLAVPTEPTSLAERYPMMFNAMIVGFTLATGLWTWLACAGRRRAEDEPWSTTARLVPHAQRFAFLCAALALVSEALMTYWPRMPSIASMDHSLGRVTAGFAAHLFLVLVMLWSSRKLRRLTYDLLTVMAVASTVGFFIVRMSPFASRLG